jgi:L-asparaginase/Glu-tRNA(Gln) amidotransferase subunit D
MVALFLSALLATASMAVQAVTDKPVVAILATGGTIAAVGTDSGYTAGKKSK